MRPDQDPTRWVDEWPLPISAMDRKRVKAILKTAQAAYLRGDFQDPYRWIEPIQKAFSDIAKLLFEADLLTVDLLENQLRLLLVESAKAGDWVYFLQDEPRIEIFPGYLGHPSAWELFNGRYRMIFSAEIAEWHGKLLEREADLAATGSSPKAARLMILDEYQTIEFDGRQYDLTKIQSVVIRILHKRYLENRPSVGIKEIRTELGTNSGKMSDWFRGKNHGLYQSLVIQTPGSRTHYRLYL
jgi:hypothetical protein